MVVGREQREEIADAAWVAARNAILACERIESCFADESLARTLGDGVEFGLVDLKNKIRTLTEAALRIDRCVAMRH